MSEREDYTLKFTRDEYFRMVKELQIPEYTLFIAIVDRILKWKLKSWTYNADVQRYGLAEDIREEVHMCLIKEAQGLIQRGDEVVDPHYFQALVLTAGVGRILNLVNREKYAHGDLSAARYEPLRRELGMQDDVSGIKQTHIPIASLETGGYSDDEEEVGLEIPDPESGYVAVEVKDEFERLTTAINDKVAACNLSFHRVLTWFMYITALRYNWYDDTFAKIWVERRYENMTLDAIVEHLDQHRETVYSACLTDDQMAKLRACLDKADKDGERVGGKVYGSYCMKGKTMRATISDWINRWNTWFKECGMLPQ